ncbi:WSCD family member AAEL009094 [Cimex lectularius]|uniref:Sulfotransferase domain-containing protein n=1 Tax=Cimex lectularius TaxID=79782 RepID=A0A8I6SKW0_CIMLE|nr:WSCD family member AAEL009094 [Cimex lectularius]XP_024083648.1 WSCD family member AAEL009094 [Cimex lectularius]
MSPFLKVMQLFLLMTATVLGMLMLLLITPDLEDSILAAMRRYHHSKQSPTPAPFISTGRSTDAYQGGGGGGMVVELDRRRKEFSPWPNSRDCSRFRVQFARQKSLPMTALVSFPGSGNTWLRYLLETATGVFTGSVYTDRQIISKGFYGEAVPPDCGCTSVQKTHGFALAGFVPQEKKKSAEVLWFRGRAILLLRNPYEALLSYRNFLYGGHTGFAPNDRFRGPDWERFALRLAVVWKELAATWINSTRGGEAIALHFERLKINPETCLHTVLSFLNIAWDSRRLSCVLSHIDGPFRRPRSPQSLIFDTRDPFSPRLHLLIDGLIHEVNDMLLKRGWEQMPVHLFKFYKGNQTKLRKSQVY